MNDIIKNSLEKIKNPKIILFLGIAGMVLILLSSFTTEKKNTDASLSTETGITAEEYKTDLEESITEIVESITGSSNIKVVITLESGIKYSYADINEGVSANKTEDNYESVSKETKQSYITVKSSDGSERALLVTTEMPEVRGVAIVCKGGDDAVINEKIEKAVTAALNITSKRVYIAGGTDNEKR